MEDDNQYIINNVNYFFFLSSINKKQRNILNFCVWSMAGKNVIDPIIGTTLDSDEYGKVVLVNIRLANTKLANKSMFIQRHYI
jgi:hypothetical protein